MRRLILCLILLLIGQLSASSVHALSLAPAAPAESSDVLGQRHYYSVYFRGNGEAVVSYKVQTTNVTSLPVYSLRYEIPQNIQINDIAVYQVTSYKPTCYPYPYDVPTPLYQEERRLLTPTPAKMTTPASPMQEQSYRVESLPCYYPQDTYSYYGGNSYQQISYTREGNVLTINLSSGIQPNNSGGFFLTFRSPSFVKREFTGAYTYIFESLKSLDGVTSMQVGITTDQGYFLKDADSKVNYNEVRAAPAALPRIAGSSVGNQELDTFYNQIGQGAVYKYASHLAAGESFSVKGMYADAIWKLHGKELGIGTLILILIILFSVISIRVIMNHMAMRKHAAEKSQITKLTDMQKRVIVTIGVSFLVSILLSIYTIVVYVLGRSINTFIPYYFEGQAIVFLLFFLVCAGMYCLLLFVPAILWGVRYGIWWAVSLFALTVAWVAFYILVIVFGMFVFSNGRMSPGYPVPMIERSAQ